jgi:cysteine desulfurase/selenocysteine lyase
MDYGRKPSTGLNIGAIRACFPILCEEVNGHPLVWLDNAATTQRPASVIERISRYYLHENSNVHRAAHTLAARSTDAYEQARATAADFIGAAGPENIVFTRGATEGLNLIAQSVVRPMLQPGDEIILTLMEHHANIVPWQMIARQTGAVLKIAPLDQTGQISLPEYEQLFGGHTRFASFTQISNVTGTIAPVAEMISIAHRHGVPACVDAAQSAGHMPIDVTALDADLLVFSGHKVFGPMGIGVLYGKTDILDKAEPYQGGGSMIEDVTFERTTYQPAPRKFEAGTPNVADAVGLAEALKFAERIGMGRIADYERELTEYAVTELRRIPSLHMVGPAEHRAGVLSFTLDGFEVERIGQYLDRQGIAVRTGHHCAQPLLRSIGLEAVVRPSLAVYNTFGEIDALASALWDLVKGVNRA